MSPRLNSAALQRLFDAGGLPLIEQMIALFLQNTPERLLTLRTCSEDRDWASVERAAHSMKSSAAYLGLEDLRRGAELAENLARDGRGEEVLDLLEVLETAYSAGRGELSRLVQHVVAS